MAKNHKNKTSAKTEKPSVSKTSDAIVNLGGKRILVYPLGHAATIGDPVRIEFASQNANSFVTLDGTTADGKNLLVTDSIGKQFPIKFSNVGSLAILNENGKLSEITIKMWQRMSDLFFGRASA